MSSRDRGAVWRFHLFGVHIKRRVLLASNAQRSLSGRDPHRTLLSITKRRDTPTWAGISIRSLAARTVNFRHLLAQMIADPAQDSRRHSLRSVEVRLSDRLCAAHVEGKRAGVRRNPDQCDWPCAPVSSCSVTRNAGLPVAAGNEMFM